MNASPAPVVSTSSTGIGGDGVHLSAGGADGSRRAALDHDASALLGEPFQRARRLGLPRHGRGLGLVREAARRSRPTARPADGRRPPPAAPRVERDRHPASARGERPARAASPTYACRCRASIRSTTSSARASSRASYVSYAPQCVTNPRSPCEVQRHGDAGQRPVLDLAGSRWEAARPRTRRGSCGSTRRCRPSRRTRRAARCGSRRRGC